MSTIDFLNNFEQFKTIAAKQFEANLPDETLVVNTNNPMLLFGKNETDDIVLSVCLHCDQGWRITHHLYSERQDEYVISFSIGNINITFDYGDSFEGAVPIVTRQNHVLSEINMEEIINTPEGYGEYESAIPLECSNEYIDEMNTLDKFIDFLNELTDNTIVFK